jgi:hypothetical protein
MRRFGRVLHVRGILDAIGLKVISPEDGEQRIKTLAAEAHLTPERLLQDCVPEFWATAVKNMPPSIGHDGVPPAGRSAERGEAAPR